MPTCSANASTAPQGTDPAGTGSPPQDRALDDIGILRCRDGQYLLRWILVHMIEATARHDGHADLIRERIVGDTDDWARPLPARC